VISVQETEAAPFILTNIEPPLLFAVSLAKAERRMTDDRTVK
jgi:hypothetical protein